MNKDSFNSFFQIWMPLMSFFMSDCTSWDLQCNIHTSGKHGHLHLVSDRSIVNRWQSWGLNTDFPALSPIPISGWYPGPQKKRDGGPWWGGSGGLCAHTYCSNTHRQWDHPPTFLGESVGRRNYRPARVAKATSNQNIALKLSSRLFNTEAESLEL